ncbi:tRNA uridine-5-carboxymethylaminomethyl(34) synthesis enzyme MnmG [Anaerosalibacter bizertensis]|uniref:tRNA uridine 5-carboxymethylaminomethyl modification enzyme MnmG n=1 Tax=Anaerosalibacter bizertensis TaxID=932217 RepID=A0A844FJE3_9FIRM|nr:tRNA uridine-5-carboxymethylaminomethyl(34) synthesis enzyme MnmG [Anaerosalibacter bizertensis]MBV1817271.1 tRNA uridine-5-carboxymethylaminomethyl(34) synthesis enzyme MnmG [Bacteroidales bacterium MSK.15.36]HHV25599.1 tRNA uridine-5-carboxymethylaminomethyl(34) synthesis enzyme MnmG [Tissierellia bacterium]MBU5294710.1 tRNA uridine-5-carboxymethylaminomethyl(34) synthesis enzyme MnmG [Anaerosalibacter bizertensis]MCB5559971.1 tRNA uridine-5-carboxymethylaminomethyl(34) synthesis enzyme Mn
MEDIKKYLGGNYDIIVVGAGHAGCEAALASSRMGMKTLMLTMTLDSIASMPCNPNIGGTGKGHLVREIDALGGEMALNIDKSFIQSRMLNTSKGPAVHSLRVQADKKKYHMEMKKVIEDEENLDLRQGEVVDIIVEDNMVKGVVTRTGAVYNGKAIILCTGTYLKGRIYIGEIDYASGPDGLFPSNILSDSLERLGIELRRFKTGTPARVHKDSIDTSKMEIQPGDEEIVPFSFLNIDKKFDIDQVPCYLTYTTEETHKIIRENLDRSPMYSGVIEGVGPRYCPSIEDKVVRFADRNKHQIFIEPEGLDTKEMYVQGMSSTLPEEVQIEMYKKVIGLENVKFMRSAYAIEYDCIDPTILKTTLEHREINNLFFAGQINGSSGYEEAAAQGLIAAINAVQNIKGKEPFILDRSEAYIGVLIDDLVTKGTNEPYRMMTSRAEYRLTLRQDNADLRLTEKGYKIGLASEERYKKVIRKKELIEKELKRLKDTIVTPTKEINSFLERNNSAKLKTASSLYDLIKRPELGYEKLKEIDIDREDIPREIRLQVETHIKYEGYIRKQMSQIEQFKKLENKKLPEDMDYKDVKGLSNEAIQKLNDIKPDSVGQASRISGVSPADVNVLLIYLEHKRRNRSGKND